MSSYKKSANYKSLLSASAAVSATKSSVSPTKAVVSTTKSSVSATKSSGIKPKSTDTRIILPPCSSYLRAIKKTERDNFLRSSMFGGVYDPPLQVEQDYEEYDDYYEEEEPYSDDDE